MTTGELIRILNRYPEDAELYVTTNEMYNAECDVRITADYDIYGNTLDLEISSK